MRRVRPALVPGAARAGAGRRAARGESTRTATARHRPTGTAGRHHRSTPSPPEVPVAERSPRPSSAPPTRAGRGSRSRRGARARPLRRRRALEPAGSSAPPRALQARQVPLRKMRRPIGDESQWWSTSPGRWIDSAAQIDFTPHDPRNRRSRHEKDCGPIRGAGSVDRSGGRPPSLSTVRRWRLSRSGHGRSPGSA